MRDFFLFSFQFQHSKRFSREKEQKIILRKYQEKIPTLIFRGFMRAENVYEVSLQDECLDGTLKLILVDIWSYFKEKIF